MEKGERKEGLTKLYKGEAQPDDDERNPERPLGPWIAAGVIPNRAEVGDDNVGPGRQCNRRDECGWRV